MSPATVARPVRRPGQAVTLHRAVAVAPLSAGELHLVRRFSGGVCPELVADVRAAGTARLWFEQQLEPTLVPDLPGATIDSWFPSVSRTPQQVVDDHLSEKLTARASAMALSRWSVARRVNSKRQLLEVMTDFWSNALHVSLHHEQAVVFRADYDRVIRSNALTSFEALLRAAVTHPAMGVYLDNASSTKAAPNENLGRELLELHTVGVDGGYTEADVKASARMLTGYRATLDGTRLNVRYSPEDHATGPVTVLDFTHANREADGRAATTAYLRHLARHPRTAERLARRLCVKFVSDAPTPAIVAAVARAYLAHGTAIKPTLRAMVDHPDFARDPLGKVRMPMEDYVATVRSLGIRMQRPTGNGSFAHAMYWQYAENGNAPFEWAAPNGYPEVGAAWASAGRVLTSFSIHQDLAARWWPTAQASFPDEGTLLPLMPATLQQVVDHLSTLMLGQKPGAAISQGIAEVLGLPLTTRLTRTQVLGSTWGLRRIQACLLGSPIHLHR